MSYRTLAGAAAVAAFTLVLSFVAAPLAASAATNTSIAFVSAEPVTAAFDTDWVLDLVVARDAPSGPVQPGEGTVDVYIDGIPGVYAHGLPIQSGGAVFFSQPSSQPLLGAGDHTVRAIFNPLGGSGLVSSQTAQTVVLTVTPLTLTATVSAVMDASVAEQPVITAVLSGPAVEAFHGAPAGTWSFTVTDPDAEIVFSREAAQVQGSTSAIVVPVDAELAHGTRFDVTSTFVPHPSLTGGLTIDGPSTSTFVSASATLTERLVAPIAAEWWMVIAAGAVLALLAAATIWLSVLSVRRRRAGRRDSGTDVGPPTSKPSEDEAPRATIAHADAPPAEPDHVLVDADTQPRPS
ncbi:hypothetical protein WJX64_04730 [Leifsonia sp. YIM 134122]|uniref:Bacterial Ig-like domain-containing protein n=1 Tax=Leifsonia stereocauli TaxID=3134136 RepID=A0ABU9W1H0_9MICO